ncbi:hypothetical protein SETIT_4G071600v2 [Setaria italica]|uniref:Terpene synthase N-terminal domain-containing protein n=1 Tax=Setaria italica TaxID=4555 RepID=A0A368QRN3_SETIT|nr:hypothetical protein SETIT_4G071600v2 [Setaria italica]
MPELLKCVIGGGACFGLLDPVSNIILSAVSYLDRLENPPPEELARRHGMSIQQQQCEESQKWIIDHVDMDFVEKIGLKFAAGRSRKGLTVFLQNYFRCLTVKQASRYVELANFDLTLAIKLVYHDRFTADPLFVPDPTSSKTKAALKQAALEARLWAPHEDFKATAKLLRKENLSSFCIRRMLKLMQWRSSTVPNSEDLNVAHLIALRHPGDLAAEMILCLESVPSLTIPWRLGKHNSSSCGYHRALKLQLLDSIHVFYLEALARLPTEFLHKHLRGILMGGHCFGPFDPVSNIILNAVWFEQAFQLDCGEDTEADVLDNRCSLRMERRSLEGLIQLVFSFIGGSHDSDGYEQKALEYLCSKKCDISHELYRATGTFDHETCTWKFISAASAAKHPQSTCLGRFYASLYTTVVGDSMRFLISGKNAISDQELHHLWDLIKVITHQEDPMDLSMGPVRTLSQNAWKVLAEKKKNFKVEQSFVRKMVDLILSKYNSAHAAAPIYKLHIICGVATSSSCSGLMCFHVNFLARTGCSFLDACYSFQSFLHLSH